MVQNPTVVASARQTATNSILIETINTIRNEVATLKATLDRTLSPMEERCILNTLEYIQDTTQNGKVAWLITTAIYPSGAMMLTDGDVASADYVAEDILEYAECMCGAIEDAIAEDAFRDAMNYIPYSNTTSDDLPF